MRVSRFRSSLAGVIVISLVFTGASWFVPEPASSHIYSDFYNGPIWYDAPTVLTVPSDDRGGTFDFYHNGSGWTTARRDRNHEAATAWNNVTGAEFTWLFRGNRADLDDTNPCNNGTEENSYDWTNIDGPYDPSTGAGSVAGEMTYCYFVYPATGQQYFKNILVRYDQQENWYTGTGSPGSNQTDFLSVATDETGHASGWLGHFLQFSTQCPPTTNPIHVMCPTLTVGYAQMRTLMSHDIHTFAAAY